MNPKKELEDAGVIKDGKLVDGVWYNSNWQILYIETNPIRVKLVELDEGQRTFYVDKDSALPWAEDIVNYIEENYGKVNL